MQVLIVTYLLLQLLKSDDGCQEFNPHEFSVATTVVSVDVLDSIVFVSPVHTSSTTQSLFQASKNASQQSLNFTCKYVSLRGWKFHPLSQLKLLLHLEQSSFGCHNKLEQGSVRLVDDVMGLPVGVGVIGFFVGDDVLAQMSSISHRLPQCQKNFSQQISYDACRYVSRKSINLSQLMSYPKLLMYIQYPTMI